jgi:hypothetical protein
MERMLESILANAAETAPVWVDMESSLRTPTADGGDVFDIGKCFACAMVAVDSYGMPDESSQGEAPRKRGRSS